MCAYGPTPFLNLNWDNVITHNVAVVLRRVMSDELMTALVEAVAHSRFADALSLKAQLLRNGVNVWDVLGSL